MSQELAYYCCDDRRRAAVARAGRGAQRHRLPRGGRPGAPQAPAAAACALRPRRRRGCAVAPVQRAASTGGERIRDVAIDSATFDGDVLVVHVSRPGDFSHLHAASSKPDGAPLAGLDPLLSAVEFSFKVECPSEFDCAPACACAPEPRVEPAIDYLAKDYASFRRLLLDRMAVLAPDWRERNPADLGVALVELLAYAARPAELPAGRGRDRGVPRHRAAARLGPPPRAAGRLPDARRLQRARVGAGRVAAGIRRPVTIPARHAGCSTELGRPRRRARDRSRTRQPLGRGPGGVRDDARGHAPPRARRDRALRLGRARVLPAAGRHARDAGRATCRTCAGATSCCSRR